MRYCLLVFKFGLIGILTVYCLPVVTIQSQMVDSRRVVELQFNNWVAESAFSPDGKSFVASRSLGGELRLWETATWTVIRNFNHSGSPRSGVFSPDSTMVVTSTAELANGGLYNSKVWFWDVKTGKSLQVIERGDVEDPVGPILFSPNGKMMAWGAGRGNLKLVDIQDLKNIKTIYEKIDLFNYSSISSMSFSPNGTYLAVAALRDPFIVFEVSTGKEVFRNKDIPHAYQIAFSPDGKTLSIAGKLQKGNEDQLTVRLFKTDSWEMIADLRDRDAGERLGFTPDGNSLIFIGERKIEVYDIRAKRVSKKITNKYSISAASIAPNGKSVAIGDLLGHTIRIYPISASAK